MLRMIRQIWNAVVGTDELIGFRDKIQRLECHFNESGLSGDLDRNGSAISRIKPEKQTNRVLFGTSKALRPAYRRLRRRRRWRRLEKHKSRLY